MKQRTLVVLKPDAVLRGISGEIISRLERCGLKIVGAKLMNVSKEMTRIHYAKDDEWKKGVGDRAIKECEEFNLKVEDIFNTTDPLKIGDTVIERNAEFMSSSPVFAIVFEGVNAVKKVRNLIGSTFPESAAPGTIRGDFGLENSFSGTVRKRTTYNLIHASGNLEEAIHEIELWFKKEELLDYKQANESIYGY
jgi:nucleoside-diphosphate kinase